MYLMQNNNVLCIGRKRLHEIEKSYQENNLVKSLGIE